MRKQNAKPNIDQNGRFKLDNHPYVYPQDINVIIEEIRHSKRLYCKFDKDLGAVSYYNIPCSFDTETSNFYIGKEKIAVMYVWMFSVNGRVIVGRTWDEFENLMRQIHMYTDLNTRLICYVHNLGFDFSFFCRRLKWYKTFCVKSREPIYCITEGGIEFRDSYILTNKSLDKSAGDLLKYKISKLVGNLDYKLVRGSKTPLTPEELSYCVHDCLVLDAVIQEKIEQEGNIGRIPLTNTGYVRRFLRSKCFPGSHHKRDKQRDEYKRLMKNLTIEPEEYETLKRSFMGGFTHASAWWVGETIEGRIDSFDFTSSYPAVILSEFFPMSKAVHYSNVSRETFDKILKNYLSIMDITFTNIRTKEGVREHYISKSKCKTTGNVKIDNGRVVSSDQLTTTITNIDLEIIKNVYDFDCFQVGEILAYEKGYLPKPIIEGTLELYKGKTELKGVEGCELEYQIKKGMLNSVYGCMVTDIVKSLTEYTNEGWEISKPDLEDSINKYNNSQKRFLYYPWGVFVTAYARRNLWMGILEFGEDYIYSDTDSIKCLNVMKHMQFITYYNNLITTKVSKVLEYYNIDPQESSPKTKDGVPKPIGVWDWETKKHEYRTFKTLGAKRYMYTQDEIDKKGNLQIDKIHITVAGLGKKTGADYISSKETPFNFFSDEMKIPTGKTGKLLHTYIDDEKEGDFLDYMGNENHFHELGGVHLEDTFYNLKIEQGFKDYLKNIREESIYDAI